MNKDNFIKLHSKVKKLCNENNVNFFEINDNYTEEIRDVYKWIDEQVEARMQ